MQDNRYLNIIRKMIIANKTHKKAIETVAVDIGIHRSRHQALMRLARHDTVKSQKEIAEELEITQAAMTVTLSKLERDGLIKRNAGKDSRFNEITVTEKGKEIVEKSKAHFSSVDAAAFEGLTDDELQTFEICLDKIQKNLTELLSKEKT